MLENEVNINVGDFLFAKVDIKLINVEKKILKKHKYDIKFHNL